MEVVVTGAGGEDAISSVVAELTGGAVVVLPTDTVYGVAASLERPDAVSAIFDVKGRPPGLALPVLVHGDEQLDAVVGAWPPSASALAGRFWPGPLTLVVPALPAVGALVGGDGRTVGVRCPDHEVVRALAVRCGPLAVTSANRHGEPPCHSVADVLSSLGDSIVSTVVDGGRCDGTPSTVVRCSGASAECLREGGIGWDAVRGALGR
jgi:tRNA threonylcarbamoyl adenosine modification protein (Sua5/YciO/YrdC/YwlC family)